MSIRVSPLVGGGRFHLAPEGWESAADSQPVGSATMTFVVAFRMPTLVGAVNRTIVSRSNFIAAGGFRLFLTTLGQVQWDVFDSGGVPRSVVPGTIFGAGSLVVASGAYDTDQSRIRLSDGSTQTGSGYTPGYFAPPAGRTFAVGFRTVNNDIPFTNGGAVYAIAMTQAQALTLAEMATYEASLIDALNQGRVPPNIRSAPVANSDFLWWGRDLADDMTTWTDRVSSIALAEVGAPELVCHPGRF